MSWKLEGKLYKKVNMLFWRGNCFSVASFPGSWWGEPGNEASFLHNFSDHVLTGLITNDSVKVELEAFASWTPKHLYVFNCKFVETSYCHCIPLSEILCLLLITSFTWSRSPGLPHFLSIYAFWCVNWRLATDQNRRILGMKPPLYKPPLYKPHCMVSIHYNMSTHTSCLNITTYVL